MVSRHAVTVLFTDLVGSTRLATSVDQGTSDAVRRAHFAVLRRAIADNDGTEVKNLGDGLMVVFDRPSAAINCAVAMQQLVHGANRDADVPLAIRVGLAVGEATSEDGDYFGDPVIIAARLCAVAASGQILATELARLLAGRHTEQEFGEMRLMELKGLAESVPALEVKWEPFGNVAVGFDIAFPASLAVQPSVGFVGREALMARLLTTFSTVQADRHVAITLLGGEPGIGKTTLAAQVAQRCAHDGAIVVFGRCDESMGLASQPFVEAMSQIVAGADETLLRRHVTEFGSALALLVPSLTRRLPDLAVHMSTDSNIDRHLLLNSIVGLLSSVASAAPVLLVLDDLQWADDSTLMLLRHLAQAATQTPLMVIGTFRATEVDRGHRFADTMATLRRQSYVERVDVDGLDEEAVVTILERGSGSPMGIHGRALASLLSRDSDGNPFFLGELVRHIVDTGLATVDQDRGWTINGDIDKIDLPGSVREVVGQRVDRLGETMRTVLTAAAVVGRHFQLELLERLVDLDTDTLIDLLDRAVLAALVVESPDRPGQYDFTHALSQHALYQELSVTRRARMHQRVAAAIEAEYGPDAPGQASTIADHLIRGARAEDLPRAAEYARVAGREALKILALSEAVRWAETAVELLERCPEQPVETRCDILIELGIARRPIGAEFRDPLHEAFELAASLADADRMGRAALARSRGSVSYAVQGDAEWIDELERAIEAQRRVGNPRFAVLLATLAAELSFTDRTRRLALAEEAEEVAVTSGDIRVELEVLNLIYVPTMEPALLARRGLQTERGLQLATVIGDPLLAAEAFLHRAFYIMEAGDFDAFCEMTKAIVETAEKIKLPYLQWRAGLCQTLVDLVRGDLDVAEASATKNLNVGLENSIPEAMLDFGVQVIMIRTMQGRSHEIADAVLNSPIEHMNAAAMQSTFVGLLLDLGRVDEAAVWFRRLVAGKFDDIPVTPGWLAVMFNVAESAARMRDIDASATLYRKLEPWADHVAYSVIGVSGVGYHALARLADVVGDRETRDRDYEAALSIYENRLRFPYQLALTQCQYAEVLLRDGEQPTRAIGLLEAASMTAESFGFGGIRARAADLFARYAPDRVVEPS